MFWCMLSSHRRLINTPMRLWSLFELCGSRIGIQVWLSRTELSITVSTVNSARKAKVDVSTWMWCLVHSRARTGTPRSAPLGPSFPQPPEGEEEGRRHHQRHPQAGLTTTTRLRHFGGRSIHVERYHHKARRPESHFHVLGDGGGCSGSDSMRQHCTESLQRRPRSGARCRGKRRTAPLR